jgi:hypothetical protein
MAWWMKFLVVIAALIAWFFGLILAGRLGYPSQYFWFSLASLAIGCAAAPFWRHRSSVWFWPSVALSVGINLAAIYLDRDFVAQVDLPSKGAVQALLVADCIGCWLLMVGFAYLADGRFPWNTRGSDES